MNYHNLNYKNQIILYSDSCIKEMSQPEKKNKKFTLPTSLKTLYQSKKNETHEFIKRFQSSSQPKEAQVKKGKGKESLFKLNPSSKALVEEVPIQTIRQKSKSLELLYGQKKQQVFNLFDHHKQIEGKMLKQKRFGPKKCISIQILDDIDLRAFSHRVDKVEDKNDNMQQEEERYEIVRPSQTYKIASQQDNQIFSSTIIQTPILPIFASEFHPSLAQDNSKRIEEGQGTWRIGKMKVKKGKCQLIIGQFIFQGSQIQGKGGAGLLKQNNLHLLPNWKNMFVFQPQENLFLGR